MSAVHVHIHHARQAGKTLALRDAIQRDRKDDAATPANEAEARKQYAELKRQAEEARKSATGKLRLTGLLEKMRQLRFKFGATVAMDSWGKDPKTMTRAQAVSELKTAFRIAGNSNNYPSKEAMASIKERARAIEAAHPGAQREAFGSRDAIWKEGERYYIPNPNNSTGFTSNTYLPNEWHKKAASEGRLFKSKEEALAVTKRMRAALGQKDAGRFEENKHPRAANGEFGSGGGGKSAGPKKSDATVNREEKQRQEGMKSSHAENKKAIAAAGWKAAGATGGHESSAKFSSSRGDVHLYGGNWSFVPKGSKTGQSTKRGEGTASLKSFLGVKDSAEPGLGVSRYQVVESKLKSVRAALAQAKKSKGYDPSVGQLERREKELIAELAKFDRMTTPEDHRTHDMSVPNYIRTTAAKMKPVPTDADMQHYAKHLQWRTPEQQAAWEAAVKGTKDALNHLGEREYQTYGAWRAAAKAAGATRFEGDKDIASAIGADGKHVGEWGGDKGSIYLKRAKDAYNDPDKVKARYAQLKSKDRQTLEGIVKQHHKIVDVKGADKESLVMMVMEAEFGRKAIEAAFP